MLTASLVSTLLLIAPSLVSADGHMPRPRGLHRAGRRVQRRGAPTNIAPGTLSPSEGCTKYYSPPVGNICQGVADAYGISLEDFYAMNTGISTDNCPDVNVGFDYCVARTTSSAAPAAASKDDNPSPVNTASPAPTTTAAKKVAAVKAAPSTTTIAPTTTKAATTTAAPSSTPASNVDDTEDCDDEDEEDDDSADDDDDEEDCDDEEDDSSDDSSSDYSSSTQAAAATTTTASAVKAAASQDSSPVASLSGASSKLAALGVTKFLGLQGDSKSIGSWYQADLSRDSTNGHSWCGYPYNDASPIFAPDVSVMLAAGGGDWETAGKIFCGLEAIVTGKDGSKTTLVIGDGFDPAWIKSPGSIDIMKDAFAKVNGGVATDDKNVVVMGTTWELTGNRNEQYKFKGVGN